MRICVIADSDEFALEQLGTADVLISCGDLPDQVILEAAKITKASAVLAVKGNHDTNEVFPHPILDLHLNAYRIGGVVFGGFRGAWKYKPRGHFLYDQIDVSELLSTFEPVDVFVAHNSPAGIHDRDDEVHQGFEGFNGYIDRARPKLFLHGHQHLNRETLRGGTRIVGVYGAQSLEFGHGETKRIAQDALLRRIEKSGWQQVTSGNQTGILRRGGTLDPNGEASS